MQKKPFTELGLSTELLKAVAQMGYEEASHIQSQAIPALLRGADVGGTIADRLGQDSGVRDSGH